MPTSKIHSAIPYGFDSRHILVECDTNRGLPTLNIVGMAGKSIEESRDRIRAAIKNSGFRFPSDKVVVNLAPAELRKAGTQLDLPISLAILTSSNQLSSDLLTDSAFVGELALTGELRPIPGIINIIESALKHHFRHLFIPEGNRAQAAPFANRIRIYPVASLRAV